MFSELVLLNKLVDINNIHILAMGLTFVMILSRYTMSFYLLTCTFDVFLVRIANTNAFGSKLYISKKIVQGNETGHINKIVMAIKNASYYFYTQVCSILYYTA